MNVTTDPDAAFVGAILSLSATAADAALALVDDADVADPRHALILVAARHLAGQGIPPDPAAVLALLRADGTVAGPAAVGGLATLLSELHIGCPVPASVRFYAAAVLDDAVRRRCEELSARVGQAAAAESLGSLLELVAAEAAAVLRLAERRNAAAGWTAPAPLRAVGE